MTGAWGCDRRRGQCSLWIDARHAMTPDEGTPHASPVDDDIPVGRVLSRREVLALLGGSALLVACAAPALTSPSPGAAETAPASSGSAATPGATSSGSVAVPSCVVRPALTDGPFFVDERLDRSDIRSDPATGAVSAGASLVLALNVSRVSGTTCAGLPGAVVDLWQCDALGVYSDVPGSGAGRKFLRGSQRTDAQGRASFTTVYPGWYQGRTVHLHFKIRSGSQEFSSQLFFDDSLTDSVFAQAPYSQRPSRSTRNVNDGIYGQNGRQLTLQCTPSGTGGYTATFDIGLSF